MAITGRGEDCVVGENISSVSRNFPFKRVGSRDKKNFESLKYNEYSYSPNCAGRIFKQFVVSYQEKILKWICLLTSMKLLTISENSLGDPLQRPCLDLKMRTESRL